MALSSYSMSLSSDSLPVNSETNRHSKFQLKHISCKSFFFVLFCFFVYFKGPVRMSAPPLQRREIRPTCGPFFYNEQITCTDMIILRQNGFLHNYLKFKQKNFFEERGEIAEHSSQTNAVQGLQVPPQNTTNTQEEVSKKSRWGDLDVKPNF